MEILELLVYPDQRLRQTTTEINIFDQNLKSLVDNMFKSMYTHKGVGLAAPQIGKSLRLFVVDVSEERNQPKVFINPQIIEKSNNNNEYEEGCLSVPEFSAKIKRPKTIVVEAYDVEGNQFTLQADDLLATCIQHEYDHLEGILFIDYLSKLKRTRYDQKLAKQKHEHSQAVAS